MKNLQKSLIIYTNSIDNDVYVEEVKLMIKTLKGHNKDFQYKVFENTSGGHGIDRIDSKVATDIRFTVYEFMADHLKPTNPFKNAQEMRKAAYGFNRIIKSIYTT